MVAGGLVPRWLVAEIRHPSCRCQSFGLGFDGSHEILDGIDFLLLEIRLSTLLAHPSWNSV
jgi:hypothetical protein